MALINVEEFLPPVLLEASDEDVALNFVLSTMPSSFSYPWLWGIKKAGLHTWKYKKGGQNIWAYGLNGRAKNEVVNHGVCNKSFVYEWDGNEFVPLKHLCRYGSFSQEPLTPFTPHLNMAKVKDCVYHKIKDELALKSLDEHRKTIELIKQGVQAHKAFPLPELNQ